jgi:hypothetical protein
MTFDEFSNILRGGVATSDVFYIIAEDGGLPEDPEWYGVEFDSGERFMFYNLKEDEFIGEYFLNGFFIDKANLYGKFYTDFYNSLLEIADNHND